MQLQFDKRDLTCLVQAVRSVKEQELTQEIRLPDSMPDVGRVLAGWGQVILRSKEWLSDQVGASGGVMVWLLYAPEDGSEPRTVNTWIPFQMKWDGVRTDREGPMRVCPLLRFVDGRNVSARKIMVRCGISCLAEALVRNVSEIYIPGSVPEDVELLKRSYPVRLPREAGEKTFSLDQRLEGGSPVIDEILSYTMTPEITYSSVKEDKIVLRGVGHLHLVYRCREGRIRTRDFEIPFSQFSELEREYENDPQADVQMAVTGLELDLEEENLVFKCGLVGQYLVTDRTVLEVVEDAYSNRREVGIRQEELCLPVILDETRERISAQGMFREKETDAVDLTFWTGNPRLHREGDTVGLEMPGRFQLIGYGPDGMLHSAFAGWDGSVTLRADSDTRVEASVIPLGQIQWNGMEARAEVQLRTTTASGRGIPMITGLELGTLREPDESRPSLILCRCSGGGLWPIAKACGSTVSAIRAANGLADDSEEKRMLLIPVQ